MIKLKELFDDVVPFHKETSEKYAYGFEVDGLNYFAHLVGDEFAFLDIYEVKDHIIDAFMERYNIKLQDRETKDIMDPIMVMEYSFASGDYGESYGVTGSGSQFTVFSTAIAILRELIKDSQADIIYFSAVKDEPTREKLYRLFVKQVGRHIPGFSWLTTDRGDFAEYFYIYDEKKVDRIMEQQYD